MFWQSTFAVFEAKPYHAKQKSKMQFMQGGLPQDYRELQEPSVPDLSDVFGQVWISATSSAKIIFLAVYLFFSCT